MTDDPAPALRAELNAALDVLSPQIEGLDDMTRATLSAESVKAISDQLGGRQRRRDLILAVLAALDSVMVALEALIADGYPSLPAVSVPGPLFEEIQKENAAIEAAVSIFEAAPLASKLSIELGAASDKPKEPING